MGFTAALAIHALLFLGLCCQGKVHPPSSATTVSITYIGPSSVGKMAEAGGVTKAVHAAPIKRKSTITDAHVSARQLMSAARVPSLAAELAPAGRMDESNEGQGAASSPAAPGATNVALPVPGVVATRSVVLSGELSVNCLERTPPVYPKLSLRLGEQGRTLLLVELDERGRVASVSVKTGSGFARLDEAAVNAVKSWHCTPAMRNGVVMRSVATQPFNFALTGR